MLRAPNARRGAPAFHRSHRRRGLAADDTARIDRARAARHCGGPPVVPGGSALIRRITCRADIEEGLAHLTRVDPRLVPVAALAGEVPLRLREPGFAGLARIVVSQQVSVASAAAIYGRLEANLVPFTPARLLVCDDAELRACGLSASKIRTLRAIALATREGLDLEGLATRPPEEAMAELTRFPGIGRWTAEIFLMFCGGHPDIFPVGDLALRSAVADAFALPHRPGGAALADMARGWSPWRGVAARLFWAYYRARRRGRESLPV
jgi:DNA-3-methyladenine glycosylase II